MIEHVLEKVMQGGWLMIPIVAVSVAAWVLILERLWVLRSALRANRSALARLGKDDGKVDLMAYPPGSTVRAVAAGRYGGPEAFAQGALETALKLEAGLEKRVSMIGRLAQTAPLLGLLGTVTGMILTFDAITLHGTGNPKAMAEGISQALVTTQAGLLTAIPVLLAQGYLLKLARRAGDTGRAALEKAYEKLYS